MTDDIVIDSSHVIPRYELMIKATRAGGPGGQHVNTSSSRVEVRWNPSESSALTPDEKVRVAQRLASRLDGKGWVRVAASDTRSQRQNRMLAEQRLAGLIARALHVRKKRIKTAPSTSAREERLRVKKLRGRRKRERGSGDFE
ncbi:MAG TPA: alternative ribosome rescue aminoacyl-tRNA hydrolase ArfB [Gemmatimonadaceae bacterium]